MARGSFAQGFEVTTSSLAAYSAPTSISKALVQKAQIINTGAGGATLQVWITPSGESPADKYKVIKDKQIGVGSTYIALELIGEYVNAGGTITVSADILGLSCYINGIQYLTED